MQFGIHDVRLALSKLYLVNGLSREDYDEIQTTIGRSDFSFKELRRIDEEELLPLFGPHLGWFRSMPKELVRVDLLSKDELQALIEKAKVKYDRIGGVRKYMIKFFVKSKTKNFWNSYEIGLLLILSLLFIHVEPDTQLSDLNDFLVKFETENEAPSIEASLRHLKWVELEGSYTYTLTELGEEMLDRFMKTDYRERLLVLEKNTDEVLDLFSRYKSPIENPEFYLR
ncbi:MAG: hypothetical protein MK078_08655 [Crocinitomicaceae bacterium]|nr:hypothetical protein [Crocinitomicaceae bacterium]